MLGKRYGLLPSEVLVRASTFDLQVLDVAISYENFKASKARGENPEISQDAMQEMIKHVRGTQ